MPPCGERDTRREQKRPRVTLNEKPARAALGSAGPGTAPALGHAPRDPQRPVQRGVPALSALQTHTVPTRPELECRLRAPTWQACPPPWPHGALGRHPEHLSLPL